ncbi:MOSC domain-containing protein [Trichocoleus desertorum AS-A10]|uniref:MOSC domain-containing protein n=1 Tax=Trichocoleus desertorum TaxID=1481672 RepID=UPI0032980C5F
MSTIEVTHLFTYFIKGLTPHAGDRVSLQAGHGIPGDRGFALMYADAASVESEAEVPWMRKNNFAMQADWPGLASLTCEYDPVTSQLMVKQQGVQLLAEVTNTSLGRDRIGAFFTGYLAALQPTATARHPEKAPLRLVGDGNSTRYPDRDPVHISLINQASLEDLGQKLGHVVDPRRFRPNVMLTGIPAWEELRWVGKTFQLGTAQVAIAAPINRCANVDVNPDTGIQDCSIFAALQPTLGHRQTGVLATVLQSGTVTIGDRLIEVTSS